MDAFFQDLRYGFRMLTKSPGVTTAAVVSLALGIGANTTIFTAVDAVFLTALPVGGADRLAQVYTLEWEFPGLFTGVSFANYEDYRDEATTFDVLASIRPLPLNLIPDDGEPQQIAAQLVTANYFEVLGLQPQVGRYFLPEEDERPVPVAVLSHGIWESRFGSDPGVVGSAVNLGGIPFDVVGVAPPGFKGLDTLGDPDLIWIPMEMRSSVLTGLLARFFDLRRARFSQVIGRLADGVTVDQARAEIFAISTRLEEEYPIDNRARWGDVQLYSPLNRNQRDQFARAGGLMMAVVGLVLLIACANVANLLLARAADREKEIGIRIAMGADRTRLFRQLLTESLILALLGGVVGIGLAMIATRALWGIRPPTLGAGSLTLELDSGVLLFTLGISVVTGVLFGLVPALQASNPDLKSTLQEGGRRGSSGSNKALLRGGLVVAEVALAVVALVGAGLFIRSLDNAQATDPGFETERLALVQLNIGNAGYSEAEGRQFWDELLQRLGAVPGVEKASLQSGRLLGGGIPHTTFPEGVDIAEGRGIHVNDIVVHPDYFETVGIDLIQGRLLTDLDRSGSALVAVINDATRRLFWPDENPIGRRFRRSAEDPAWVYEVVGMVDDATIDLAEGPEPVIYTPLDQFPQPPAHRARCWTRFARWSGPWTRTFRSSSWSRSRTRWSRPSGLPAPGPPCSASSVSWPWPWPSSGSTE
jgi:predicted permease